MRRIATTAAALLAVALLVPGSARADVLQPDCIYDPVNGETPRAIAVGDSCSAAFEITAAETGHRVSQLGSHAGFHAFPSAGGFGRVSMQWKDANGAVVAEWSCVGMGVRADGEHERTLSPACSTVTAPPASLPVGSHTLVATVTELQHAPAAGPRLHARLVLRNDLPL